MFWIGLLVGAALGFSLGVILVAMFLANGDNEYKHYESKENDFEIEKIEEIWIDNGRVIN